MAIEFDLSGLHDEHTIKSTVPPPLSELCIRELAHNFASRPTLRGIANRYINRMTELLPTDLPLEVTGPLFGTLCIAIVQSYQHLGTINHGARFFELELMSRIGQADSAYKAFSKNILRNKSISLARLFVV